MTDTLWADVSEFQVPVNNQYPHDLFAFRSNDGTHRDRNCAANLTWSNRAITSGRLFAYIVYYFYRPGVDCVGVMQQMVGRPNPKMVAMIDVENAGGAILGNQSATVNTQFDRLAAWLGDPKRVIGYGNVYDLNALWPVKPPGIRLIVANYDGVATYPGMFAQQYSDSQPCPPFGPCDGNRSPMGQADLEAMFGLTTPTTAAPEDDMFIKEPNGALYQLIYNGQQSYWRLVPATLAAALPASQVTSDPSGGWLALWQTAPATP
jgi:hypothetical protein